MTTAFISHSDCALHDMGAYHPERPARLQAIQRQLQESGLVKQLLCLDATPATRAQITRVHPEAHVARIHALAPQEGRADIDADTSLCPHSLNAAYLAAGALVQGVDAVCKGAVSNAFCAVRPPGHHAESATSMGFCVFNNVAVGVRHAQQAWGLGRVAVLDFDVHHGNGTVEIFKDDPSVLVCSSFQHPFYPGRYSDVQRPNIVNTPLPAGTASDAFRAAILRDWTPALERHAPELIFISAGFDAHQDDPLGGLNLVEADYRWVTDWIVSQARHYCSGKIVSTLEGGYDLDALAKSVHAHLSALVEGGSEMERVR